MSAMLYGASLALAGWLAARAIAVAEARRLRSRLVDASAVDRRGRRRPSARGASVAAGVVVAAALGWTWMGPFGLALGATAPWATARWISARRSAHLRGEVERQLEDAVVAISAGVRAGLSARLAVAEAARDAASPLDESLGEVVRALELGEPLDRALERLVQPLAGGEIRLVVDVLRIHRRTGGDLPSLLDRVAEIIGERRRERRHLRALTAQATASGAVLAALPVAFVALLSGAGGDGLGAFYRTPTGTLLLAVGLALDAAGFAWMRGIVRAVERA